MNDSSIEKKKAFTYYPISSIGEKYPSSLDPVKVFYDFVILNNEQSLPISRPEYNRILRKCVWQRIDIGGILLTSAQFGTAEQEGSQYCLRKDRYIGLSAHYRGASHYMREVVKKCGFHIGHQAFGNDGVCSGAVAITRLPPGTILIHQVRHPLKTITSVSRFMRDIKTVSGTFSYVDLNNDSKLLMAMKYWYYFNKVAEARNFYIYRVEDIDNVWHQITSLLDVDVPEVPNVKRNIGLHNMTEPYFTWNDLYREDAQLTESIKRMASRYGYDTRE